MIIPLLWLIGELNKQLLPVISRQCTNVCVSVCVCASVWLHSPSFHANLKSNAFEGYTQQETQCFLLLISSTLFTPTYCSTVIKKLMQRPSTILTFHQGWDDLLSENSFVTSSECSFLFLFLAVFKILFQVLTHFVASKIRGTEKDCDLPEELLPHSHSTQWGLQSGDNFSFAQVLNGSFLFQL